MQRLPVDFASTLARVLVPGSGAAAAEIINAAARLDDEGLATFLRLFAARVRESAAPIRADELRRFLEAASRPAGGQDGP